MEEHGPVHTDGTEVKYGCSAKHHIHGHQPITHHHVQGPHSTLKLEIDSKYTYIHDTKLFAVNLEQERYIPLELMIGQSVQGKTQYVPS